VGGEIIEKRKESKGGRKSKKGKGERKRVEESPRMERMDVISGEFVRKKTRGKGSHTAFPLAKQPVLEERACVVGEKGTRPSGKKTGGLRG